MIKLASLVSYKIIPAVIGGEKGIYYFLQYLGKIASITCFTVSENKTTGKENFVAVPLLGSKQNKFRYINPFLFFKLKRECAERGIQHLIIEHPYYGWLGYFLKKFAGIKLIVHSHNIENSRFKTMGKWWWRIMYWYERFAHRSADLNFFISQEDKDFAIDAFKLNPEKCTVITYGIEENEAPVSEKSIAKEEVCEALGIYPGANIILFNGALGYLPNLNAVDKILQHISPLLKEKIKRPYKIIICGKGLPDQYENLKSFEKDNIIYAGFVPDIAQYFSAADVFINPITDGGGIKTKLVEALAVNTAAVSFTSGAYGVPLKITGNNLTVIADDDYNAFADAIVAKLNSPKESIPSAFFKHFAWSNIAEKAAQKIKEM